MHIDTTSLATLQLDDASRMPLKRERNCVHHTTTECERSLQTHDAFERLRSGFERLAVTTQRDEQRSQREHRGAENRGAQRFSNALEQHTREG